MRFGASHLLAVSPTLLVQRLTRVTAVRGASDQKVGSAPKTGSAVFPAVVPMTRPFHEDSAAVPRDVDLPGLVAEEATGQYFADCKPRTSNKNPYDTATATRLWRPTPTSSASPHRRQKLTHSAPHPARHGRPEAHITKAFLRSPLRRQRRAAVVARELTPTAVEALTTLSATFERATDDAAIMNLDMKMPEPVGR